MSITTDRLASRILREIVHIINDVVRNTQVGYITITETKVTRDLSFATIYYTIIHDDEALRVRCQELLESSKKEIRMRLAERIDNIRKIPDLIFKFDEALAYGNHIHKLLSEINKK
ncbi:Ribosome-binding factor A [Acholeplasma oculi]|uniref:Ribosome-binding factor A n=1 Tax=Acholeplasma oculi TaxID=35623 RepID=A0A061ABJ7_9MOLU|nr:30S ribosome-binding factor RbfA [Acholeplasma oculi]CDR31188.1 Ribosome-binding factor A [Acholeplasma oculi]SKC37810.1 ribosome-binding factor A [Acholeplasma oculi]SUT91097.1 Ribosome-binding factor A [Acholeplasma oculi]